MHEKLFGRGDRQWETGYAMIGALPEPALEVADVQGLGMCSGEAQEAAEPAPASPPTPIYSQGPA